MGVWYLIVNPERREYLDMEVFGDHEKTAFARDGERNLHLVALKWLLVSREPEFAHPSSEATKETYAGLWNGTKTYIVSDHDSRTGLVPEDDPNPDQNLYGYALDNYRDISQPVFEELLRESDHFFLSVNEILENREWGASRLIHSLERIQVGTMETGRSIWAAGLLEAYYRAEARLYNK